MVADLKPKQRVQVHLLFLKSLVEAGMLVTELHRAVYFKQRAWIAPFVLENTKKRDCARDSFEKAFFKLIINSQVIFEKKKFEIFLCTLCAGRRFVKKMLKKIF